MSPTSEKTLMRTSRHSTDRLRLTAFLGAALALLASCPSAPPPLPPVPALTVTPAAQTVQARGGNVNFTATLTGATGDIGWTLTGPGSISSSTGASTTYTPPTAFDSTKTTATLTASAASLTASATITIQPPQPITVAGTLVDQNGVPVATTPVLILGQSGQTSVTDASGKFSLANVSIPYDVVAVIQPATRKLVVIYLGLTRSDPTLTALQQSVTPLTATINGNLTPAGAAGPPADVTYLAYAAPNAPTASGILGVSGAAATYTMTAAWQGSPDPDPTGGTIHALRWTPNASFNPTAGTYRYGELSGNSVSSGGTLNGRNVTLGSVGSKTASGTVAAPGLTLGFKEFWVRFASGAAINLGSDNTAASSFSFPTPDLSAAAPGATLEVIAYAYTSAGDVTYLSSRGLDLGASSVSATVPVPPTLALPVNNATSVDHNTIFQWTQLSSGVHMLDVAPACGVGCQVQYHIVTAGLSATLPDLTAQGLPLPSAQAYNWYVEGFGPFADADAAAGPSGIFGSLFSTSGLVGPPILSFSTTRQLTTK